MTLTVVHGGYSAQNLAEGLQVQFMNRLQRTNVTIADDLQGSWLLQFSYWRPHVVHLVIRSLPLQESFAIDVHVFRNGFNNKRVMREALEVAVNFQGIEFDEMLFDGALLQTMEAYPSTRIHSLVIRIRTNLSHQTGDVAKLIWAIAKEADARMRL